MNAAIRESDLAAAVPAARVLFTTEQIRQIAIETLLRLGSKRLRSLHEIEYYDDPAELRRSSIIGTVLAPIVTALNARGMRLEYTYGAVERALDFTAVEMHAAFCDCENGPYMECRMASQMIAIVPQLRRAAAAFHSGHVVI